MRAAGEEDDQQALAELLEAAMQQAQANEEAESKALTRAKLKEIDWLEFGQDPPGHRAGFVAIIGRPNAGKSTLLNSLLGQTLSIVTHKAQTTRHRVLGILSEPEYQAVFLDTPGIIQDKRNKLEERMMARVAEAVADADALLAIVDLSSPDPRAVLAMVQPGADWAGPPLAVVLNKTDLVPPEEVEELTEWYRTHARAEVVLPISALEGANVEAVRDWVVSKMPEGPALYPKGVVAEAPERFFVAEIIRRQVFLQYRQELPYSVAVQVVDFKERKSGKDYIHAHVIVEKDGQRGILLGKGGTALKALSTASRAEVEDFLGRSVFLELSVKVREKWRTDPKSLEVLGY